MAAAPSMSAFFSEDGTILYFFDKTGAYNVSSNPTGYGAPNAATSDFTSATLTIILGGATAQLDPIDIHASFPTTNTSLAWQVTAASQGLTVFPAGLTRITYNLAGTFGGVSIGYNPTKLILSDQEFCCCLKEKQIDLAQNPPESCNCTTDKRIAEMLTIEAILSGAQAATCCGDIATVNTNIATLKTLCGSGCGCQ